jgi:hypothetical protein
VEYKRLKATDVTIPAAKVTASLFEFFMVARCLSGEANAVTDDKWSSKVSNGKRTAANVSLMRTSSFLLHT